jgi:hypothetical protein
MTTPAPLEHFCDLRRLSDAGIEVDIEADAPARERIAPWLGADSVRALKARVSVEPKSPNRFSYVADFVCDLVQKSVVSLEPVDAHIEGSFSRELHLTDRRRPTRDKGEELTLAAGDDESPEEIDGPHYDLMAPVLEELSLALDPYPRAPGEEFAEPDPADPEKVSPFAALKTLKEQG